MSTKNNLKTRFVTLVAGCASALFFFSACVPPAPAPPAPTSLPGSALPTPSATKPLLSMEQEIFDDVNAERIARGLPALRWDRNLSLSASQWNQTMSSTGIFAHSNLQLLFSSPPYDQYGGLGENIYKAQSVLVTSGMIHVAWTRSNGHRKNVLSPAFDSLGVAVLCVNGITFATEHFGRQAQSSLPPVGSGGVPAAEPIVINGQSGSYC